LVVHNKLNKYSIKEYKGEYVNIKDYIKDKIFKRYSGFVEGYKYIYYKIGNNLVYFRINIYEIDDD